MSKNTKKVVKTETELKKLIEDTRKLRRAEKPIYKPSVFLILDGLDIANYRKSGFPTFNDVKLVLESCIPKYKPISVVVDSSMRYLIPEEEVTEFEQALNKGIQVKNVIVQIIEVNSFEQVITRLLKLAVDNNAKVLSNQNLIESYETIKQRKISSSFIGKQFQVSYKITESEITIFEQ